MIVQFFIMYPLEQKTATSQIVYGSDRAEIARKYLTGWFPLDFGTMLPSAFSMVTTLQAYSERLHTSSEVSDISIQNDDANRNLMFLRVLRAVRMVKVCFPLYDGGGIARSCQATCNRRARPFSTLDVQAAHQLASHTRAHLNSSHSLPHQPSQQLVRLVRVSKIYERWQARVSLSFATVMVIKCIAAVLLSAHWFACTIALQTTLHTYAHETWLVRFGYCIEAERCACSLPPPPTPVLDVIG